jgi:hypothetical protein
MRIIGCDLHARQQTVAMLDTTTGEVVKMTLTHEGNNVREFYGKPGACGDPRALGLDGPSGVFMQRRLSPTMRLCL